MKGIKTSSAKHFQEMNFISNFHKTIKINRKITQIFDNLAFNQVLKFYYTIFICLGLSQGQKAEKIRFFKYKNSD